jgi:hypothetical protein
MYDSCRSCFGKAFSHFKEAINKTPKPHNLFVLDPNNVYFGALESDKTH